MQKKTKIHFSGQARTILASLWLLITLSLASWWMILGLKKITEVKIQHMLHWEGCFFIFILIAGGSALIFFSYAEEKRHSQIKHFFSAFTHDLKTSLASLRLQAEVLEEAGKNIHLSRLLQDIVRLELQLSNSLYFANTDSVALFLEKVSLAKTLEHLKYYWPDMKIILEKDVELLVDKRALESILKNIFQNARIHGEASEVRVSTELGTKKVLLRISDNGRGFQGDLRELSKGFMKDYQFSKGGSSGLGLYLSRILVERMKGKISFEKNSPCGLTALLTLGSEYGGSK